MTVTSQILQTQLSTLLAASCNTVAPLPSDSPSDSPTQPSYQPPQYVTPTGVSCDIFFFPIFYTNTVVLSLLCRLVRSRRKRQSHLVLHQTYPKFDSFGAANPTALKSASLLLKLIHILLLVILYNDLIWSQTMNRLQQELTHIHSLLALLHPIATVGRMIWLSRLGDN